LLSASFHSQLFINILLFYDQLSERQDLLFYGIMSGLNETERKAIEGAIGSNCYIHCSAAVRLYFAPAGSNYWTYTQLMGVAILLTDRTLNSYFIRLLDLNTKETLFQQEFYNNFQYVSTSKQWFHVFEIADGIAGFSFADQTEAQRFFSSVITCKTKALSSKELIARTVSTPNLNYDNYRGSKTDSFLMKAPRDRPNPEGNYESAKDRKKREERERKEEKLRRKREQKLKKEQEKHDAGRKPMIIDGPTMVAHVSHIGWDPANGFQIRNIPPEWKMLFKSAGVRRADLENPETAAFIYATVATAMASGARPPPAPPTASVPASRPPPAPPTIPQAGPNNPRFGSMLSSSSSAAAAPPPPPGPGGGFGRAQSYQAYHEEPSYQEDPPYYEEGPSYQEDQPYYDGDNGAPPPPPPPAPSNGSRSGGRSATGNPLLSAISQKSQNLKRPQEMEEPQADISDSSGSAVNLLQTLQSAMAQRRIDIKEDNMSDDEEEWDNEDW